VIAQKSGAKMIGISERPGFELKVVSDQRPITRLFWEQLGLPLIIKQLGIDVFHSLHYTRPLWLPSKSVVTLHDMTFFIFPELHTRPKRFFFPLAIRTSGRLADRLIADSESTRRDAISLLNIPPGKIDTVLLGVDSTFQTMRDEGKLASIRKKYDLPDRFILYVGLVEPRKNLPGLIRAYHSLLHVVESHDLVIVGRLGWMSDGVFEQVEKLGLKNRIQFTGYISQEDLPWVYNLSALFVYPTHYEGFGLPALEAMACGVPVITTNISSMPEIVGDAGMLVEPNQDQNLIDAMVKVLTDPELRVILSVKGQQRAKQFTWERTALETLNVYRKVGETN
jgi:glycosyltransferase involved in cell wall biosynthesis